MLMRRLIEEMQRKGKRSLSNHKNQHLDPLGVTKKGKRLK
jgi:hypothetical protein